MRVSKETLRSHMEKDRYGDFLLTPAIRPAISPKIIPVNGYRVAYNTGMLKFQISASREKIIGLFISLMKLTGKRPDVFLEVSNYNEERIVSSYLREGMERIVLESHIYGIEEILLGNGFVSIGIRGSTTEVCLDSHKLISVYTNRPASTARIIKRNGIPYIPSLEFFCEEAGHFHADFEGLMEGFLSFAREIEAE